MHSDIGGDDVSEMRTKRMYVCYWWRWMEFFIWENFSYRIAVNMYKRCLIGISVCLWRDVRFDVGQPFIAAFYGSRLIPVSNNEEFAGVQFVVNKCDHGTGCESSFAVVCVNFSVCCCCCLSRCDVVVIPCRHAHVVASFCSNVLHYTSDCQLPERQVLPRRRKRWAHHPSHTQMQYSRNSQPRSCTQQWTIRCMARLRIRKTCSISKALSGNASPEITLNSRCLYSETNWASRFLRYRFNPQICWEHKEYNM